MNILSLLSPEVLANEVDSMGEKVESGEQICAIKLKDDNEADDCLGRILWAQQKLADNEALVKAQKERLMAQLMDYEHRLNNRLRNYMAYQKDLLKEYLESKFGEGKTGTLPLFNGNAQLKKPSESLAIDDEETVVSWLKANGFNNAINTKETVKKTEAKKLFKKDKSGQFLVDGDGNVIQGMHIEKADGPQLAVSAPKAGNTTRVA